MVVKTCGLVDLLFMFVYSIAKHGGGFSYVDLASGGPKFVGCVYHFVRDFC